MTQTYNCPMRISIYTTPECAQCRMTKKMLDEANVPYESIDLSQDAEALEMVRELGYTAAPVVITDSTHWSGFRHERILNAIAQYRTNLVHEAA